MLFTLSEPRPNGPNVARLFLQLLEVKLTASTLQKEIEDHPDYPSLLSLSDVFSKYGVENITANFATEQLAGLPAPFITQLKIGEGEIEYFTVIRRIENGKALMLDPLSNKWAWIPQKKLQEESTGIVLMAEPMADAGEPDYKLKRKEEKLRSLVNPLLIAVLLGASLFTAGNAFAISGMAAWLPVLYFLSTLAGVGLGILLVWYELDRYNPVIRQICKPTKTINCNAILQSDAAKIGGVSWSAIGLSYFTGNASLLLLYGLAGPGTLMITGSMSVLALPFTVFSLYYQWRVARQWCMLCLYVQGILLIQAVLALAGGWPAGLAREIPSPGQLMGAAALYIIPLLVLIILIPVLKTAKEARWSNRRVNRLKYDPIIFNALLEKQKNIHESAEGIGILLGTPGATNKIIKVCNPYCGPCAKAHVPIDELVHQHPDIELRIIFTATTDPADTKRLPVQHFLSIASTQDPDLLKQALDDWYLAREKDYQAFAGKYPVTENLAVHDEKIRAMKKWCDEEGITGTPTIYVNNYELPELYNPEDLKRFFMA